MGLFEFVAHFATNCLFVGPQRWRRSFTVMAGLSLQVVGKRLRDMPLVPELRLAARLAGPRIPGSATGARTADPRLPLRCSLFHRHMRDGMARAGVAGGLHESRLHGWSSKACWSSGPVWQASNGGLPPGGGGCPDDEEVAGAACGARGRPTPPRRRAVAGTSPDSRPERLGGMQPPPSGGGPAASRLPAWWDLMIPG